MDTYWERWAQRWASEHLPRQGDRDAFLQTRVKGERPEPDGEQQQSAPKQRSHS